MSKAQSEAFGAYLYCVTYAKPFGGNGGSGAGLQTQGIAGRPVRVVRQGDLAAVVSDSPLEEYDITRDNVTAHEQVIEEVMRRTDVLPVSFGTVAGSDREVRERLLQSESDELHRQLEYVKNRVELGVRALWEQDRLFAEIVAGDERIQALRDQIVGTTPEQTYDIRIQLGELTNAAIERTREQDAAAILDALSPLAMDTRTNEVITDMMVLNAAFLVDKANVQAFASKVNTLNQSYGGRMSLQYAGPLPPYSFVSVAVHWEEPSGAVAQ